jgi:outer membrane PBP1 activator LpoA protein
MGALVVAAALPALSIAQAPPTSSDAPKDAPPARADAEIALVLPLSSATYGRAASAVKAGFLAAAALANARPAVIAHGDGDVEAAFAQARATGARVIVGPLVRDDVRTVAAAGIDAPLVLALNQLDDAASLPPNMYALTLSVESDGRQLARLAREAGAQTIAVVGSDSPLQKRFATAFVDAWLLQGGAAPLTLHLDRSPEMLALLRRELARTPVDAVLLAVDSADAALVKPYLGTRAVYAGSTVNDRPTREAMRDLEDVRFVEIPWLATPDARELASIPRGDFANASLDRLYALGIDAFQVAQMLAGGRVDRIELDGATGHLTLEGTRQFARDARPMQYASGQAVPAIP